jgi:hypothetical protein
MAGIGPITVDPATQNLGVGRKLMQVVMDRTRERHPAGMRLVQAAYHNRSLSLYTTLGFDVREPLSCVQGRPLDRNVPGCVVRPAQPRDLEACNALSRRVHGFDRGTEFGGWHPPENSMCRGARELHYWIRDNFGFLWPCNGGEQPGHASR